MELILIPTENNTCSPDTLDYDDIAHYVRPSGKVGTDEYVYENSYGLSAHLLQPNH